MSFDTNPQASPLTRRAYQARDNNGRVLGQVTANTIQLAVAKFHERFDRFDHAIWAEGGHWVRPVSDAEAKAYVESVLGVEYREGVRC